MVKPPRPSPWDLIAKVPALNFLYRMKIKREVLCTLQQSPDPAVCAERLILFAQARGPACLKATMMAIAEAKIQLRKNKS
jgi:hypothetical protein